MTPLEAGDGIGREGTGTHWGPWGRFSRSCAVAGALKKVAPSLIPGDLTRSVITVYFVLTELIFAAARK